MTVTSWWASAGRGFLDLLVPRVCASCGVAVGADGEQLCAACGWDLAGLVGGSYCRTCGEDRHAHLLLDGRCTGCRQGERKLRFDAFVRVGRYAGALQRLILRYKHDFTLDRFLGDLLAGAIQGRLDTQAIDYWAPIPSHWRRRWRRGFQPTGLLARAAVRRWGGCVDEALTLTRYVQPFHYGMGMAQRMEAVAGLFAARSPARLKGRRVCLIDDVTTTGATLAEARRTLRRAGAAWVGAAVVAKVSNLPPISQGVDRFPGSL